MNLNIYFSRQNILGPKPKQHKIIDSGIQLLSEKTHKSRLNIQSATDRNIRNERKTLKKNEMEEKLYELEHSKNDSNIYYQALRVLNRDKLKIPLCVHDKK